MAPRKLTGEERALWQKVADSTTPLTPEQARAVARSAVKPVSKSAKTPIPRPKQPESRPPVSGHAGPGVPDAPPAMDHKAYRKLKGGKLVPEARLDLHGLTLARAQPRLAGFIRDNAAAGRRLVLVITGKGRGSPDDGPLPTRPGALRHAVPHWLHSAPLKPLVLQVSEAHRRHGGEGALYVYLRRRR